MTKKIVMCSMAAVMAIASLYGCGGGGDSGPAPVTPTPSGTQVLSSTQTSVAATAGADVFKLENATTAGYTATITNGFKYPTDKISYPVAGQRPTAVAGGVNDVIDGNVDLTWPSNGKDVTIHLTGLDAISEGALQSSAPNAAADIYTTY